jgi:MoxR-like ATPase
VVTLDGVLELQAAAGAVHVEPEVRDYVVALVRATRGHRDLALGASPRAALDLLAAARGRGAARRSGPRGAGGRPGPGRPGPRAPARHREHARWSDLDGRDVVRDVVAATPVPLEP